jgi:hypothetical protein
MYLDRAHLRRPADKDLVPPPVGWETRALIHFSAGQLRAALPRPFLREEPSS